MARNPLVVLAAAVLLAGSVISSAIGLGPLVARITMPLLGNAGSQALFAVLLYGMLAVIGMVGRRLAGPAGADRARGVVGPTAGGLAIGVGGLLLALLLATLAGSSMIGAPASGGFATLLLGTLVVLGQSAGEEIYFRGWLQPVLVRNWDLWPGVLTTAIAFAGLHVAGGARGPVALVNLAAGGILFGLLAARAGGLPAAIAAHFGWNWAETILFGLDPNPGTGSFGAIRNLDLGGSELWGGSAEGLNGSIAMTVVLIAVLLPVIARSRVTPPARD